jgi:hypothetical protein
MVKKDDDDFLIQGIARYSKALAVIQQFKTKMPERLERIAKQKSNWKHFALSSKRNAFESGAGGNFGSGHWAYTSFDGNLTKSGSPTTLEMGIWWNPPTLDLPVVFYANVWEKPERLLIFNPRISNSRIRHFMLWKTTRLYIEPNSANNLDGDFNQLLDELLANIGKG